jgi:hypothetical protein
MATTAAITTVKAMRPKRATGKTPLTSAFWTEKYRYRPKEVVSRGRKKDSGATLTHAQYY